MMQRAYMYSIFIYFLPLVFIGAFFLLNLTLAVINSKFTEAHHEQQAKDEALHAAEKNVERGIAEEKDD
jgi:cell division protein FtsB